MCLSNKASTSGPLAFATSLLHPFLGNSQLPCDTQVLKPECTLTQSCPTLCNPLYPTRLLCLWDFSGKNTGVGCHFLPLGIFLTQGVKQYLLCLLPWQVDSLPLCHLGSPNSPNLFDITFIFLHLIEVIHTLKHMVAQLVKNLPAVQETWVRSLGQ